MKPATTYTAVVGALLHMAREQNRLDQKGVAAKMGLSQPSWSRIERGDSPLGIEQLCRAAQVLGTKPSKILGDADSVVAHLRRNGVLVTDSRVPEAIKQGLAVIGFAALCLLLVKLLSK